MHASFLPGVLHLALHKQAPFGDDSFLRLAFSFRPLDGLAEGGRGGGGGSQPPGQGGGGGGGVGGASGGRGGVSLELKELAFSRLSLC